MVLCVAGSVPEAGWEGNATEIPGAVMDDERPSGRRRPQSLSLRSHGEWFRGNPSRRGGSLANHLIGPHQQ